MRVVLEEQIKLVNREITVFVCSIRLNMTQGFIFFTPSAFAIIFAVVFTTRPNPSQE
jgi:hypothetical protein